MIRKKTTIFALLFLICAVALFASIGCYMVGSFELLAYKEGKAVFTSADLPDDARSIKGYSPKGHFRDFDAKGILVSSEFVFEFPATMEAEIVPEQVTYRSLRNNVGFSLPHGSRSSELTVQGEAALSYMPIWMHIDVAESMDGWYGNDQDDLDSAAIDSVNNPFLEVELCYPCGIKGMKRYSVYSGDKDDYGMVGNIVVAKEL